MLSGEDDDQGSRAVDFLDPASSMSLVAVGPLMKVTGRTGSSTAKTSGTLLHDISDAHDEHVHVGHEGDDASPAGLPGVEDDGAGLGDRHGRTCVTPQAQCRTERAIPLLGNPRLRTGAPRTSAAN